MATINLGGFETGNTAESSATGGTFSVQSVTVRSGTYALRVNPTTTNTGNFNINTYAASGASAAANVSTSFVRFYFRYATKPSTNDEEFFKVQTDAAVAKLSLRLNSSGKIAAYDTLIALLQTGNTVLSANTWYRIEVKVGTGSSAAYEVKIDGVSEFSGNGNLSTSNGGIAVFGKAANRNGNTVDFFYDDYLWSDSAYPGAGAVAIMKPRADGNYTIWTNDYTKIKEVPPDGATTIVSRDSTGSIGDAETPQLDSTATAGISGTINSAKAITINRKNVSGTTGTRLRSNITDSDTSGALTVAFTQNCKIFDTDPNTSSAWLLGGLDAVQVGPVLKAVPAAGDQAECTVAYLMVDFVKVIRPNLLVYQAVNRSNIY